MDAALAHVGIAHLMSYHAAQFLADGRLRVVLAEFEPPLASVESGLFQPAAGAAETSRFLRFRNAKIARNLGVSVRLRLKIFEVTQQSASGNGADDLTGCSTAETGLR